MSTQKHGPSVVLYIFLFGLLVLGQVACSPNQRTAVANAAAVINNGVDESLQIPDDLVFAGQISDASKQWVNNYVIVLFKNGKEMARTHSQLHESPLSGQGPMDGVFELRINNEYDLTTEHEFLQDGLPLTMRPVNGMMGQAYIGTWFDLAPNNFRVIKVPGKQLEYAIVVLEMPLNEVPTGYQRGNLAFENGRLLINQQDNQQNLIVEHITEVATVVPTPQAAVQMVSTTVNKPAPQSNFELVLLPSNNNGEDWHLQLTGYYGNRWDVWERFVAGYGHPMSWEMFKDAVLAHNPQLESDGFVFYADKAYLLPSMQ